MSAGNITLPIWLVQRAVSCLARAEAEGAFKGAAVPVIGLHTLNALERELNKELKK